MLEPVLGSPLRSILSDQPANEDRLGFAPYARTLAEIIADPDTRTPLTIGIFGGWGRGKTSLMRMVQRRLEDTEGTKFRVQSVWFNAWFYSQQQALWRALISRVLGGVRDFRTLTPADEAALHQLEARLYGVTAPAGGHLTLPAGALAGLQEVALPPLMGLELLRRQALREDDQQTARDLERLIADVEESEAHTRRDQITALDDFRRQFEEISRQYVVDNGRLAIFVDDLDRCLPDRAVEVLEAIKLFLDVPGCVFLLGIAREVIEEGIRVRYADYETTLDGALYLEKIIQLPFSLPPIAPEAVQDYVHQVTGADQPHPSWEKVFAVGLEPNPRRIKRTLNIFLLLSRLAQNRDDLRGVIKPVRLAKIVIIQQYHPRLFDLIAEGPHYLVDLEHRFRESQEDRGGADEGEALRGRLPGGRGMAADTAEGEADISAGPLKEFLGRGLLRALLTCTAPDEPDANFADIGPSGVREYVYLTRSTMQEPAGAATAEVQAPQPLEPQMVTIPAGRFLMGTPPAQVDALWRTLQAESKDVKREWVERETPQHGVTLEEYAIGRYPVTNAEFKRFVDDGGYANPDYWTKAGWKAREANGWIQPSYWDAERCNDPAQPVVGVSWYEAVAYCRWLADRTGKPYRLPTEAEWEKAARGDRDSRRYPWGDNWEPKRCHSKESGLGRAVPVGQYPGGDSPYGVGDMAGQVWEWCSSRYGGYADNPVFGYPYRSDDGREDLEGDDTRILRGGSWYNGGGYCRCSSRDGFIPGYGIDYAGFRCARDSLSAP